MKKTKRFNDGGMSLEEMYPEAKITRVPYQEPPKESQSKAYKEAEADYKKSMPQSSGTRVTQPKFSDAGDTQGLTKVGRGRVAGGGGGSASGDFGSGLQKMNRDLKRNYKAGGKVSSASKRADGCAVKGKTRGRIV
jgi:hypothetical protein